MIEETTTNRNYPKPNTKNLLRDDVARLRNALDQIDADVHTIKQEQTQKSTVTDTIKNSLDQVKAKIESAPPVPALSSSDIAPNRFTLSWPQVMGATFYCLDVATDESFTTFVGDYENKKLTATSVSLTGLPDNTTYYCRIRSATLWVVSKSSTVLEVSTLDVEDKSHTFVYSGLIETWTVPAHVTSLTIEAWGAQGGFNNIGSVGAKGARMQGDFVVRPGDKLKILVGQQGPKMGNAIIHGNSYAIQCSGGGGGSFVVKEVEENGHLMNDGTRVEPLIVAAGGGGIGAENGAQDGVAGQTETSGSLDNRGNGQGGSDGNGGNSNSGGGGGGFLQGGSSKDIGGYPGASFLSGSGGGNSAMGTASGGFGGGGGCHEWRGSGGGGGGYSGGSGGYLVDGIYGGGGGGGSYNSGTNKITTETTRTGHGQVIFRWIGLV
jgi:hypothetical protein